MKKFLSQLIKENIRISLIDGELSVKVPKTGVDNAIIEEIKSKKKDLIAYLSDLKKNDDTNSVVINKVAEHTDYQLSNAQHRLWILNQFKDQAPAYNIFTQIPLHGLYDVACFERSLFSVIERHEILRTVFRELDTGEVRQFVLSTDELGFVFDYQDFRGFDDPEVSGTSYMQEDFYKPFDLEKGPLLRVSLLQISDDHYIFYLNMHHIISDGWSLEVLSRDVILYYEAYSQNTEPIISPLRIQYKDYANWQFNQLSDSTHKDREDYWLNRLSGDLPRIDLPTSNQRPKFKTSNGRYLSTYLDKDLSTKMQSFIKQHQGSLFMLTLSAINVLLYKYTSNKDILIGSPVAGRSHGDLEDQIGFYVNVLALRNDLDPSSTFVDFYHKIKENTIRDFEHQEYPYDKLVESLGMGFDASRASLYDVLLTFHGNSVNQKKFEIEESFCNEIRDRGVVANKNDIEFHLMPMGDVISFEIIFNDDLYDTSMITKMMYHFKQLLSSLLSDPNQLLSGVDYLSREEKRELLEDLNATDTSFSSKKTLVDLFRDQVIRTPDAVALVFEQMELTYQQLDDRSNALANYLITHHSIGTGDLVGIKMERSEWLMISIFAVLKAGGAYVPIDIAYPNEKIRFIEKESELKTSIDEEFLRKFLEHKIEDTKVVENRSYSPDNLAYVIYTSGSSGVPKGVAITHASLFNYLTWASSYYFEKEQQASFGLFTSLSFDLTVTSLFLPIITGQSLYIFNSTDDIVKILTDYLNNDNIKAIKLTPAHINVIGNLNISTTKLEKVIVGGDILHNTQVKILKDLNSHIKIYNEYGPTEATVGCTVYEVSNEDSNILIGKPIANTQIYLLDENLNIVPKGIIGEIFIAGNGLAKGYLNKELSEQKFVPHLFEENKVMYKTGDLAFWTEGGELNFLGRKDNQVKIQGHRIELGEVEHTILKNKIITEAVVISIDNEENEKEMIAYFTAEIAIAETEIRDFFRKYQPSYIVPSRFIQVAEMPLTTNGKVNRIQLLKLIQPKTKENNKIQKISPKNEIEEKIIEIWQEVLKREVSSLDDNFYDLGGNSLKLIRLINEYYKVFNIKLNMKTLFSNATLASHADIITSSVKEEFVGIEKVTLSNGYPLSDPQKAFWLLSRFKERAVAYNIPILLELLGDYDVNLFKKAILASIDRHEILRTVFKENEDEEVRQWVKPVTEINFDVKYFDYSGFDNATEKVQQFVEKDSFIPFNLENGPLLRASLFKIEDEKYLFYYNMYHIVSDEVSMDILKRDVLSFYSAYQTSMTPKLPELKIQYKDYAFWQQSNINSQKKNEDRQYWLDKLSGSLPHLDLPKQKNRPKLKTYNGHTLAAYLSLETGKKLKSFCTEKQGSLFMGAISAWYVLLHKYTSNKDIILGTPVAGREHSDLKDQIGCYINNIALRQRLLPTWNFNQVFDNVKKSIIADYDHQTYPFHRLAEDLNLSNDLSRNQIFDVMFSFHIADENLDKVEVDYTDEILDLGNERSKLDILINFYEHHGYLYFTINFNTDIYESKTIKELIQSYKALLTRLLDAPETSMLDINYLNEIAKEKIDKNKQRLKLLSVR